MIISTIITAISGVTGVTVIRVGADGEGITRGHADFRSIPGAGSGPGVGRHATVCSPSGARCVARPSGRVTPGVA